MECLENELFEAKATIEDQKGQVVVKRSDEDIAKIEEQESIINNLQQEVGYVKKELIEARAHKSASDDKLSTVQDKIETLQNNINSLTDEGKLDFYERKKSWNFFLILKKSPKPKGTLVSRKKLRKSFF